MPRIIFFLFLNSKSWKFHYSRPTHISALIFQKSKARQKETFSIEERRALVIIKKVSAATLSFRDFKVPGIYGIYSTMLKGIERLDQPLGNIFLTNLALSYIPTTWNLALSYIPITWNRVGWSSYLSLGKMNI